MNLTTHAEKVWLSQGHIYFECRRCFIFEESEGWNGGHLCCDSRGISVLNMAFSRKSADQECCHCSTSLTGHVVVCINPITWGGGGDVAHEYWVIFYLEYLCQILRFQKVWVTGGGGPISSPNPANCCQTQPSNRVNLVKTNLSYHCVMNVGSAAKLSKLSYGIENKISDKAVQKCKD